MPRYELSYAKDDKHTFDSKADLAQHLRAHLATKRPMFAPIVIRRTLQDVTAWALRVSRGQPHRTDGLPYSWYDLPGGIELRVK